MGKGKAIELSRIITINGYDLILIKWYKDDIYSVKLRVLHEGRFLEYLISCEGKQQRDDTFDQYNDVNALEFIETLAAL